MGPYAMQHAGWICEKTMMNDKDECGSTTFSFLQHPWWALSDRSFALTSMEALQKATINTQFCRAVETDCMHEVILNGDIVLLGHCRSMGIFYGAPERTLGETGL